jgi:hypothetical protein
MADEQLPMRPQDQTNFLLGQLTGQVSSLQSSVDSNAASQSEINATFRGDIARAQSTADTARSENAILAQRIPTKTAWYQIVGGLAGITGLILSVVALSKLLLF